MFFTLNDEITLHYYMITLITKYVDILAKEALLFHMKNDDD